MILVIDVTRGIQAQTVECLVVGNILTDQMIIVLNKIDLIDADKRDKTIEKVKLGLKKALKSTRFKDAMMIPLAASVGGGGLDTTASADDKVVLGSAAGKQRISVLCTSQVCASHHMIDELS